MKKETNKFYGYKWIMSHGVFRYIAFFKTKEAAEKYADDIVNHCNEQGGYFPRGLNWEIDELEFEEDKENDNN